MPSDVAKAIGASYAETKGHLEILEAEGILTHIKFGRRIRYYKFNETRKVFAMDEFDGSGLPNFVDVGGGYSE